MVLVKCESKSPRVKGAVFHPTLSWVLVSLHNGTIQLWDYRLGCVIEKFEEHAGPVRAVDFHQTRPIFASGGDDHMIRIWDYTKTASEFTLPGHSDYIRTVKFHHTSPWLCSASDDQTIRIWNWQARQCIAILTGHHHYVMCAEFHPTEPLLLSASLDQTIRVWDLVGLKEKSTATSRPTAGTSEVFGATDVVCKFILDGHERGVNWCTFHPTQPLIASAADDKTIRLWRYDDSRWWLMETLKGHHHNVCSVVFHPTANAVISNSEDHTVRVWDINRRMHIETYRRDSDRFWTLAVQPAGGLYVAGHDSGMMIFKLTRERPAATTWNVESDKLAALYVKNNKLYLHPDLDNLSRQPICVSSDCVRDPLDVITQGPHTLLRNPLATTEVCLALLYKTAGLGSNFSFDLISFPETVLSMIAAEACSTSHRRVYGMCQSLAWVARNKCVYINEEGRLFSHTLSTPPEIKEIVLERFTADRVFYAGANKVLLRGDQSVGLYDLINKKMVSILNLTISGSYGTKGKVRRVVWSSNGQYVALLSKHYVCLATSQLKYLTSLHECIRVKSGVWDAQGGFVYNTSSHLKYLLTNGDKGIFHSLPDSGVYLQAAARSQVYVIDRNLNLSTIAIDSSQEVLKIALMKNRPDTVASLLKNQMPPGHAFVGYLRQKGYAEIAYHCVSDPATKAVLATEFADLELASQAAAQLGNRIGWNRLGEVALELGDVDVAEKAFQKARAYSRLIQLYLLTANFQKLSKLASVLLDLGDKTTAMHISVLCGDMELRVKILLAMKQPALAWMTASTHGLRELADSIELDLSPDVMKTLKANPLNSSGLVAPPLSVSTTVAKSHWPLKQTEPTAEQLYFRGAFAQILSQAPTGVRPQDISRDLGVAPKPKDVDNFLSDDESEVEAVPQWAQDDDDDWLAVPEEEADGGAQTSDTLPLKEESEQGGDPELMNGKMVCKGARLRGLTVGDMVALGDFTQAVEIIDKRISLGNLDALKPIMQRGFIAAQSYVPALPFTKNLYVPALAEGAGLAQPARPFNLYTHNTLKDIQKAGVAAFNAGDFKDAEETLRRMIATAVFVTVETSEEKNKLVDRIQAGANLLTVARINIARAANKTNNTNVEDSKRIDLELAVLATFCDVSKPTLHLLLRDAAKTAAMSENHVTSAAVSNTALAVEFLFPLQHLSRSRPVHLNPLSLIIMLQVLTRLLEEDFGAVLRPADLERYKRTLALAEEKGTNAFTIGVDPSTPTDRARICAASLRLLKPMEEEVKCALCGTLAEESQDGIVCPTCAVAKLTVGHDLLGLNFMVPAKI